MHCNREYTDDYLLHLLLVGNEEAFALLFERYRARVFAEAYYHLKNEEDALDVTQEVFIYIWQKRQSIQIKASLPSYLVGMARYKSMDVLQRRSKAKKLSTNYAVLREKLIHTHTNMEVREGEQRQFTLYQQLRQAIDAIHNPNRRLAVQKRYLEEKSLPEISAEMGYPEQTIRNWLSQAMKQLRQTITHKS